MYSTAVVAMIIMFIWTSDSIIKQSCMDSFVGSMLKGNLDGDKTFINTNANVQPQSLADLGEETKMEDEGFLGDNPIQGGYGGEVEEEVEVGYPTGGDTVEGVKSNKYDTDISQYNPHQFFTGEQTPIVSKKEEPIVQDFPTRIDDKWLMQANAEVGRDEDYISEYMGNEMKKMSGDKFLDRTQFMAQNALDNEYYQTLSRVDVYREDTLDKLGNNPYSSSRPTIWNDKDDFDVYY